jgi:hypothetical protein
MLSRTEVNLNKPNYNAITALEKRFTDNFVIEVIQYNRKGCWWWHLMDHIDNNLMIKAGSLGNVPQILKKGSHISDY